MNDFCRPEACSCIPGIKCDVKECIHNDKAYHCTAESIIVTPDSAKREDAACETYRKG